jgi:hypothetical protein
MYTFIKSDDAELEKLAEGATHMDDIDLVMSPVDGALVPCAMKGGKHVCWECGETFNEGIPARRRSEVKHGHVRILLHAGCEDYDVRKRVHQNPAQLFNNNLRGMQYRRQLAHAARGSQSVADAAKSVTLADRIRSKSR